MSYILMLAISYCFKTSFIFFNLQHSSSTKSIIEKYLPGTAAFLIDRSAGRGRELLLFVVRGKASDSDAVCSCSQIH